MRIFISVIGKTDPKQCNKNSILTLQIYGLSFSSKKFAFLQLLVFFFECFKLKYSRNLLGSKYDLTMRHFRGPLHVRSWPPQILIGIWSNSTFWKMMSYETKWIAFLGAKSRCFLSRSCCPAKVMRFAYETLSFQDSKIRATQWSNIFNRHQQ